jgi:hypothetical protein
MTPKPGDLWMMRARKQLCFITDVDGDEMTVSYLYEGQLCVIDLMLFFSCFEWISCKAP